MFKSEVIMCYFHVLQNIRKKRDMLGTYLEEVCDDIRKLHYSDSQKNFNNLKKKSITKWRRYGLETFIEYFSKQWLDGVFCNWCIFNTPPGYSTTNNPVESNNAVIKNFFTFRYE